MEFLFSLAFHYKISPDTTGEKLWGGEEQWESLSVLQEKQNLMAAPTLLSHQTELTTIQQTCTKYDNSNLHLHSCHSARTCSKFSKVSIIPQPYDLGISDLILVSQQEGVKYPGQGDPASRQVWN